jgi:ABC-type antimicrobial peptide transport system permease subunit
MALGLAATLGLTRFLGSLLFEVSPLEPPVLLAGAGGLSLAALVAAFGPARRAASVDPATTLRAE